MGGSIEYLTKNEINALLNNQDTRCNYQSITNDQLCFGYWCLFGYCFLVIGYLAGRCT